LGIALKRLNYLPLTGFSASLLLSTWTWAQTTAIGQLKKQLSLAQHDSVRAQRYLELAETLSQHDTDSSVFYIHKGIELAKRLPNRRLLATGYSQLGYLSFLGSNYAHSLKALQQAAQVSRSLPLDSTRLCIQTRLSIVYRSQGNYHKALQVCLVNLPFYERHQIQCGKHLGVLYTELGIIYDYLHQYGLAKFYLRKNLKFAQKRKDKGYLTASLLNIGAFYLDIQEYKQARAYIQQSLSLARKLRLDRYTSVSYINLGEIAYHHRNYGQSIRYFKQALSLKHQRDYNEKDAYCFLFLAKNHLAIGRLERATIDLKKALVTFEHIKSAHYKQQVLEVKSELLKLKGNYRAALQTKEEAHALKDSLTGLEKQQVIAQIQARFELEQKQHQISALKKDLTIQKQVRQAVQLQLSMVHLQRQFYLVSAGLLFLLLGYSYYNLRRSQKARRLVVQQKDEIQSQKAQLEELNQTKDQLFSIISHDLRSSVASLKNSVFLLTLRQTLDAGTKELVLQIDRLQHSFDNVLYWALSQQRGLTVIKQIVPLAAIVEEVLSGFQGLIDQKKLCITFSPKFVNGYMDENLAIIVIRNLIHNAIKYTPTGGTIRLRIDQTSTTVSLCIVDTGPGMDVGQSMPVMGRGTGFGLQVSQELMSLDGGKFRIRSQLGKGTIVLLCWPKHKEAQ